MEIVSLPPSQSVLHLDHPTHAAEARRLALSSSEGMKMSQAEAGELAIVVTEMATNVVKHASSGKMIFQRIASNGSQGLRVLALDRGPGIANIPAAMHDGYSTAGTNGSGLGAVSRLSSRFDLFSGRGQGACVVAEFWPGRNESPQSPVDIAAVSIPLRGEAVCGDGWATRSSLSRTWIMVVDGLGHGPFAADAAREAEKVFAESHGNSPSAVLRDVHDALKKTRGAAAAIAVIDQNSKTVVLAGVGNISASLVTSHGSRGIASQNGTLGHYMHNTQEYQLPWSADSVLVMHSDGISSRWDLREFRGIWSHDASVIAGMLYRDFAKEKDDVTALVAKNPQ